MIALIVSVLSWPSRASADADSDRYEQYRYALETIHLTYYQYVTRQSGFRAVGCMSGSEGCRKPAPYNSFDWSDDGCSGADQIGSISSFYRTLFNQPCRLHDFGYRNFGKGLTLYRNESMRLAIDDRFKAEMFRLCNNKYPGWKKYINWVACQDEASIVYSAVRRLSNWGASGSPPPSLDNCPSGDFSESSADGTCGTPSQDYCPNGDYSGSPYDETCESLPPTASIQLTQGGSATFGYWYDVYLTGFKPGSRVTLTCRDSIDPGGFWSQTFTIDGAGRVREATLCFSGDHPRHWVTSSSGIESDRLRW
ncbi:phospholipase A2 [Jatrophihabitans sp.]|uniref:phospholipase A2 n=1 Tax=Jatrophihabitans sp. TaxID=1932789 RepID=UPI002C9C0166|nr:phospholipase A2 [Jatrophihabitans sp.]